MNQRLFSGATALVLALLVLACGTGGTATSVPASGGSTSSAPAPSSPVGVGQRAESGGIALTVTKVDMADTIGQFQKASAGNQFLIAEVLIETTDRDKAPYNPLYFKVKSSSGVEYNGTISTASDSLKSGDLAKGDKVRGTVAFEVPKAAATYVLSYEPLVIGGGFKPIQVQLAK